jgi:hypothetical protein
MRGEPQHATWWAVNLVGGSSTCLLQVRMRMLVDMCIPSPPCHCLPALLLPIFPQHYTQLSFRCCVDKLQAGTAGAAHTTACYDSIYNDNNAARSGRVLTHHCATPSLRPAAQRHGGPASPAEPAWQCLLLSCCWPKCVHVTPVYVAMLMLLTPPQRCPYLLSAACCCWVHAHVYGAI